MTLLVATTASDKRPDVLATTMSTYAKQQLYTLTIVSVGFYCVLIDDNIDKITLMTVEIA